MSLFRFGLEDGFQRVSSPDILRKPTAPLPLIRDSHRGAHSSLGHLCDTSIQSDEDVFVPYAWRRLES